MPHRVAGQKNQSNCMGKCDYVIREDRGEHALGWNKMKQQNHHKIHKVCINDSSTEKSVWVWNRGVIRGWQEPHQASKQEWKLDHHS